MSSKSLFHSCMVETNALFCSIQQALGDRRTGTCGKETLKCHVAAMGGQQLDKTLQKPSNYRPRLCR